MLENGFYAVYVEASGEIVIFGRSDTCAVEGSILEARKETNTIIASMQKNEL